MSSRGLVFRFVGFCLLLGLLCAAPVVAQDYEIVAVGPAPVAVESASNICFTVELRQVARAPGPATVNWSTESLSAGGGDYISVTSQSLSLLNVGDQATGCVDLSDDSTWEEDEQFAVVLSNPSGALRGTASILMTITDDDSRTITSVTSPGALAVTEGNPISADFSISPGPGPEFKVFYHLEPGTASPGADYTDLQPGSMTVPAGNTFFSININTTDDDAVEDDETFTIVVDGVSHPAYTLTPFSEQATISDNDQVSVVIRSASAQEHNPPDPQEFLRFRVEADRADHPDIQLIVNYGNVSAQSQDYIPQIADGGIFVLEAGLLAKDLLVEVKNDNTLEGPESFQVGLTAQTPAPWLNVSSTPAVGHILDDDSAPPTTVFFGSGPTSSTTEGVGSGVPIEANGMGPTDTVFVEWQFVSGSAERGVDFSDGSGSHTFSGGFGPNATFNPTFGATQDSLWEGDETFTIRIVEVIGAELVGPAEHTFTIVDDDLPNLAVVVGQVVEGTSGTTTKLPVRLELDGTPPAGESVDVTWTLTLGTGLGQASAADVIDPVNPQLVTMTNRVHSFEIEIFADDRDEPALETFDINLSAIGVASFPSSVQAGILDDDDKTVVTIGNATQSEDQAFIKFPVTISPAVDFEIDVDYYTEDRTATGGSDYTARTPSTGGHHKISAGALNAEIAVPLLDDTDVEGDEQFFIRISEINTATGGDDFIVLANVEALGTILDVETIVPVSLSVTDQVVDEQEGMVTTLELPIFFDADPAACSFITYKTVNGSAVAGEDFEGFTGRSVEVCPGPVRGIDSGAFLTVDIFHDGIDEPGAETMQLEITNWNPTYLDVPVPVIDVTINDIDPVAAALPVLTVGDVELTEGDSGTQVLEFDLVVTGIPSPGASVDFQTVDGTAKAPLDYTARAGTQPLGAGSNKVAVQVRSDTAVEPNESFELVLSNPQGVTLGAGADRATGLIKNDDTNPGPAPPPPPPSPPPTTSVLTVSPVEVLEGDAGGTPVEVKVSLSPAATSLVTVDWALESGSAMANSDFRGTSGSVSFAPGQSERVIMLEVIADTQREAIESFTVVLSNPQGATLGSSRATVTILDDDQDLPVLTVELPASVDESARRLGARLLLSGDSAGPVDVQLRALSMSAVAGQDFEGRTETVSWGAGQTGERIVRVGILDDYLAEGDEKFMVEVTLLTGDTAQFAGSGGAVTIKDDDRAVRLVAEETELSSKVGEQVTLAVRAIDANDQGIGNAEIEWSTEVATIETGTLTRSDSRGDSEQRVRMPTLPGMVTVTARLAGREHDRNSAATVQFQVSVRGNLGDHFGDDQPDEDSIADALDEACVDPEATMAELCDYLYTLPTVGATRSAVAAITPTGLPIKGDVALASSRTQMQNVTQRQTALRTGNAPSGVSGLGFDIQGQGVSAGQLDQGLDSWEAEGAAETRAVDRALEEVRTEAGIASEQDSENEQDGDRSGDANYLLDERGESRLGWFVNGRISIGEHERTAVEPGYDIGTRGVTAGLDWKWKRSYIGTALGYIDSRTDIGHDDGRLETSGATLSVYSGAQFGRFYADGALSYGSLTFDSRRRIELPLAWNGRTVYYADGSADAEQWSLNGGLGYDFQLGRLDTSGFVRATSSRVEIDGFTEGGNTGLEVSVAAQTIESTIGEIGLETALPVSKSWGIMNPVARVSWFHEFENDSRGIPGTFVVDTSAQQFRS